LEDETAVGLDVGVDGTIVGMSVGLEGTDVGRTEGLDGNVDGLEVGWGGEKANVMVDADAPMAVIIIPVSFIIPLLYALVFG
jgi:hypothetical protein